MQNFSLLAYIIIFEYVNILLSMLNECLIAEMLLNILTVFKNHTAYFFKRK